jgi:hypothetical protein
MPFTVKVDFRCVAPRREARTDQNHAFLSVKLGGQIGYALRAPI